MRKTTLSSLLPLALVAGLVGAPAASLGGAGACPAPVLDGLPTYSGGDAVTLSWSAGDSGGFIVQSSEDGLVNPDGSFVNVSGGNGSLPASTTSYEFTGLTEGVRYFNVRAKNKPGGCSASAWSNIESTIQDGTGPVITLEEPSDAALVLSATGLTVSGTLVDPPIGSLPGSGAAAVTITLTNTTPGVGELVGAPDAVTVDASDGTFSHTFAGVIAGTYTVTAVGADTAGNTGDAASADFIVVSVG